MFNRIRFVIAYVLSFGQWKIRLLERGIMAETLAFCHAGLLEIQGVFKSTHRHRRLGGLVGAEGGWWAEGAKKDSPPIFVETVEKKPPAE